MADLIETANWEAGIYQIETSDPVVGGAPNPATGAGLSNIPHLQLARRTAWLKQQVDQLIADFGDIGIPDVSGLQSALNLKANIASPALTGTPTAPTPAADTNTTALATAAFVVGQAGTANPTMDSTAAVGTSLRYARQDHRHPTDTSRAPVASPAFTGSPTAPTPAADTNSTALATTAFVVGQAGTVTPNMDGVAALGTSLRYARADHRHPSDTSRAPVASPSFTGSPTAPTPDADNNSTALATTAFVVGQAGTANPVMDGTAAAGTSLRFARQDHRHPTDTTRAPIASPAFTGTPTAPTPAAGNNSTELATTAFVASATAATAIGVGQAWTDVRTSRSVNTIYQNTTGRPIQVSVSAADGFSPIPLQVSANASNWNTISVASLVGTNVQAIIPNGNFYRVPGNQQASIWMELR